MAAPRDDIARISGPDTMAKPEASSAQGTTQAQPAPAATGIANGQRNDSMANVPKKKKRGGKKHKRARRKSFAAPSEAGTEDASGLEERPSMVEAPRASTQGSGFYRLKTGKGSNTSIESEALLDHRRHEPMRSRRQSLQQSGFARQSMAFARHRNSLAQIGTSSGQRARFAQAPERAIAEDDDEVDPTDSTPLLSRSAREPPKPGLSRSNSGFKNYGSHGGHRTRRASVNSRASSRRKLDLSVRGPSGIEEEEDYDVNNPPSVPSSPKIGSLDDIMIDSDLAGNHSDRGRDAVITIDEDESDRRFSSSPDEMRRRPTVAELAEMDVCFPGDDDGSEVGEEDDDDRRSRQGSSHRRRRTRQLPDLEILEEWSREEKEERTQQEHIRSKKIKEPEMVGGRLRAIKTVWHREEEEAPFRFTYFNELLDGTIHAQTISDLLQDGATFADLFRPEAPELSDSSEDEEEDSATIHGLNGKVPGDQQMKQSQTFSEAGDKRSPSTSKSNTGSNTPSNVHSQATTPRPYRERPSKKYGARPTFWLDVLKPTDTEMKVLAKAFGIHQLTIEDILVEEPREKVELFSNYYFVNYRSFEQDKDNEDYMEPVNIYVVVFRDGVITFHQSMTPHPANVRRRIRQLNDYMSPTADWISYAIIDDVTDVYAPLVSQIETEVDHIDDDILYLHQAAGGPLPKEEKAPYNKSKRQGSGNEKDGASNSGDNGARDMAAQRTEGDKSTGDARGDMLQRVGVCRKKVMGLYRLLGNKADVIKGFAKRCNEQWEVAPRSEIGLYLGDIQDHIVTMTGNLSHYENLLSRAHSNYLAQINIRMNERAEQTADVLGKLTVLGTIVLPMNIITGMWGMNVWVPGQGYEGDLTWFWCITAGLLAFGLTCYFVAKKVYGIV